MQSNLSSTPPRFILGRISGGSVCGRCPLCLPGNVAMFVRTVNELKRRLMSQESGAQTPICSSSHRGDITISSHSVSQIPMSRDTRRLHTSIYIQIFGHTYAARFTSLWPKPALTGRHSLWGYLPRNRLYDLCILDDAETEHACKYMCDAKI